MIDKFEQVKNQFIVDEAEYPKEKLVHLMEIMLKFLRISKGGQVVIVKNVPTRKILPLILCSRFIANKVDKKIKESLSREELLTYSYLKKEVFNARFNELIRENFAKKEGDNVKAANILMVERFLEKLVGQEND